MKKTFKEKTLFAFGAFALSVLAATAIIAFQFMHGWTSSGDWVRHSYQVSTEIEQLDTALTTAEFCCRGYLLTGDESLFERYNSLLPSARSEEKELRKLTKDNPVQQRNLDILEPLLIREQAWQKEVMALLKSGSYAAAGRKLPYLNAKEFIEDVHRMDDVRSVLHQMGLEEKTLLNRRLSTYQATTSKTVGATVAGFSLGFTFLAIIIYVLSKEVFRAQGAEETLRKSEERYRSLIIATAQVVWTTDANGQVLEDMPSWREYTGQSYDEIKGSGWAGALHPDDRARTIEVWSRALENRSLYETYYRMRRSDGEYRLMVARGTPITEADGSIREWVGTCTDITEKKRAEEALQVSEKRYRMLFDTIDEGFCIVEMIFDEHERPVDYRFLEVNPSFEKQTGLVGAQGKRMRELAPQHEEFWFETYGKIALTGEPARFQNLAEQLHRWYDVYAFRFGEPENRQVAILFNDITERRRTEEALRESEEKFRLLVDSAQDYAIVMLGTDGRVASWNEGAQRMKGYTASEIIGKHFSCFYPEDDVRDGKPELELKIASETGRFEDEGLRVRKDGSHFQANVVINAIRDKSGKLRGFSKITRDITERKQAEDEIKKLNEDLEKRVVERTTELTAVNKELEAFTYSVSHDLRAPLRHIHGFVDLLVQTSGQNLDEKGKRYLATISKAASQMGNLVDDLLTFSRMGRTEIKKHTIDLENMVYGVIDEMKYELRERDIEWKVGGLAPVYGDPSLLRLVMVNLIANAAKFTRQRDKAVIEIGSYTEAGGEDVVYVKDNGVGFDMRYVDKLFGVFQRLHSIEEFEGTGIGLANIRRIISRHGGRTWAEGAIGTGAAFYFSLPSKDGDNV